MLQVIGLVHHAYQFYCLNHREKPTMQQQQQKQQYFVYVSKPRKLYTSFLRSFDSLYCCSSSLAMMANTVFLVAVARILDSKA